MSGVPLGQRTGSNGSLQLHIQNTVLLQNHGAPIVLRKPSKVLLPVSREKEKSFSRMFKFTGRRGFGMLLLVVISVVVCMSILSAICKDEVAPEGALFTHDVALEVTDLHHRITLDLLNNTSERVSLDRWEAPQNVKRKGNKKITGDQMKDKSSTLLNILPVNDAPPGHPCQSFAFPPPPADKKRTGPRPCPVCYLPVEEAIMQMPSVPSKSPVLENLTYAYEETPVRTVPFGGSDFGGYPSLEQRNESFDIKGSMNVHCGFVKGYKPGRHTGFDIDDADLFEMDQCRGVVVASAIFGNYDIIQQPKNISEAAKENVCFYMFLDEETEASIINSSVLEDRKKIGLWRIVVVRNLPYVDARRTGKVPKLLLHRMFPNARYSLWIDGKLELVVDPYQILERFLWRSGATFAISRHYKRFDVFVEAEANKAAGKYDNSSIDFQVDFYKAEGLTPYSVAKLPLTSDVPEGCVIIREHIPITNLFTCLWFNEVDRFTSRDQISFSTVRDKIMAKVDWRINMFMDCERRNFVVQAYHKDVLDHMSPPPPSLPRPKPAKALAGITTINIPEKTPARKSTPKRGRDRRSKRHRKTAAGSRDSNSIQFL